RADRRRLARPRPRGSGGGGGGRPASAPRDPRRVPRGPRPARVAGRPRRGGGDRPRGARRDREVASAPRTGRTRPSPPRGTRSRRPAVQPTEPMSDRTASAHPDELLAGFVDGTLPAEERATVERHVAECVRCADEVSLAAQARSALRALPLLKAPGLTVKDLHVVTPIAKARRWNRVAWGAGIAAAAALVVVFALTSLHPSHGTSGAAGVPANGKANEGLPGIVSNGM